MTVGASLTRVEQMFRAARLSYGHGTLNARDEAAWLVCAATGIDFHMLGAELERVPSAAQHRRIQTFAQDRISSRRPLAYVLGEAWLAGRRFLVDERVIVPRSFIAELLAEKMRPWISKPSRVLRVLDMCAGSACLAILSAYAFPKARIDAADISASALALAKRNIALHKMRSRIELVKSDLFVSLGRRRYDLIISNPPYVTDPSMRKLPREYRHEPRIALAGGKDGLRVVEKIITEYTTYLNRGGALVMEIGTNRRVFERRYPDLPVTWLSTDDQEGQVLLLEKK